MSEKDITIFTGASGVSIKTDNIRFPLAYLPYIIVVNDIEYRLNQENCKYRLATKEEIEKSEVCYKELVKLKEQPKTLINKICGFFNKQ